jgi:thiol-disulfide isomerase/thioredoxin
MWLCVVFLVACASTDESRKDVSGLGWLDRSVFERPEHHAFKERYDTVVIQHELVNLIRNVSNDVEVIVFLGTWCGDSRREVPRFLKVAEYAGLASSRIRFYGLDRSKKSNDGLTERHRIEHVPTFIFLRDGVELGRITETPVATIEADMLAILTATGKR